MVWLRGHPYDYDNWAEITGEERWSYDEVLQYFKKSETFTGIGDGKYHCVIPHSFHNFVCSTPENYHGYSGEVTLSSPSFSPIAKYFLKAAEELGYKILDQNAPYQEG
jgi:choline dehydrogenase